MQPEKLLQELQITFGRCARPKKLLDMSEQTRHRYATETAAFDAMDWENGTPDDLDAFYELNTFLSSEGYRYLIPKIFAFCMRWPDVNKDIINVVFMLPFVSDLDTFLEGYSTQEKKLLWYFLEEGHKLIGEDVFEEHGVEGMFLKAKLMGAGHENINFKE